MQKKIMALLCAVALLLGNNSSITVTAAKKPFSLNRNSIILKVNQSRKLTVKKYGKVKIWKKTFTSVSKKIAVVNKTGRVTAKKIGKTTIKVRVKYRKKNEKKFRNVTLNCKIIVKAMGQGSIPNQPEKAPGTDSMPLPLRSALPPATGGAVQPGSDLPTNTDQPSDIIYINGEPAKNLEITLYSKPAIDAIEMPSDYQLTYPLVVTGYKNSVRFKDESYLSGYMTLDENQCIPVSKSSYDFDKEIIVVADGNEVASIIVHYISYEKVYVENLLDNIINEIIKINMSEYEKMEAITRYVAENFSYNSSYSGGVSELIYGGGDCRANSDLIRGLLDRVGIPNRRHQENGGAFGGHVNVVACADGIVYELEAGYTGNAPRKYDIYNLGDGLICYARHDDNGEVVSNILGDYECFADAGVVLPEEIDGLPLSAIMQNAFYYGVHYGGIEISSIHIPKTVDYIGIGAFYGIDDLKSITVAEDNPNFIAKDNLLYSRDMTELYYIAEGQYESVEIPDSVTEIKGYCSAWDEDLKKIAFGSGIKTIGNAAFWATGISSIELPEGLEVIGDGAFSETKITEVVVPKSVKKIGAGAFESYTPITVTILNKDAELGEEFVYTNATIRGYKNSTAEQYAYNNGIIFEEIS